MVLLYLNKVDNSLDVLPKSLVKEKDARFIGCLFSLHNVEN